MKNSQDPTPVIAAMAYLTAALNEKADRTTHIQALFETLRSIRSTGRVNLEPCCIEALVRLGEALLDREPMTVVEEYLNALLIHQGLHDG